MARQPVLALAGVPRVNLMPRMEIEQRERASLTRVWAVIVGVAVLVAFVVIAGVAFLWVTAEAQLAAERARTNALITEIASYSDVSNAVGDVLTLEAFRAGALSNDFAWTPLVATITGALPEGVVLSSFSFAPGTPAAGEDPTAEVGATGALALTGLTAGDQATTVAALAAVDGVKHVDAGSFTAGAEGEYSFNIRITFDQTIYEGSGN